MIDRYPRPGWPHRQALLLRDALAIGGCLLVVVLTALELYQAVVAFLVALLVGTIAVMYASRPDAAHVDAWNRNHRNRAGDRW